MAAPRSKLLVLNAGSSSLKFKVFQWLGAGAGASGTAAGASAAAGGSPELQPLAAGLCERIGDPAGGAVMRVRAPPCHPRFWRWLPARRSLSLLGQLLPTQLEPRSAPIKHTSAPNRACQPSQPAWLPAALRRPLQAPPAGVGANG